MRRHDLISWLLYLSFLPAQSVPCILHHQPSILFLYIKTIRGFTNNFSLSQSFLLEYLLEKWNVNLAYRWVRFYSGRVWWWRSNEMDSGWFHIRLFVCTLRHLNDTSQLSCISMGIRISLLISVRMCVVGSCFVYFDIRLVLLSKVEI